jgi:hypothetical protein
VIERLVDQNPVAIYNFKNAEGFRAQPVVVIWRHVELAGYADITLNGLKRRGLIALDAGVLRLTPAGRSYREHLLG